MDLTEPLDSVPPESQVSISSPQEFIPETVVPAATPFEQDVPMSDNNVEPGPKVLSFKEKLLNLDSTSQDDEDNEFVLQQGDVSIGLNGNVTTVDFATHVLETLNNKMGLACKLIDLEEDCFLVRFKDNLDYQNALLNDPWVIFGHYLTVHPWSPSFKPHEHTINQAMWWIRLPKLPARYYHKSIIRSIGSVFGEVIRIDYNTESGDRGKFSRLAVTIDLTKPLISKIQVDGEIIFVEYEGLPTICFDCGRYGHLKEACPGKIGPGPVIPPATENPTDCEIPLPKATAQVRDLTNYGEWMLVQRRPHRTIEKAVRKNAPEDGRIVASTSRYKVLNEVDPQSEERQEVHVQENEFQHQMTEGNSHKKKGKETKGAPRASTGNNQKAHVPLTRNQDFTPSHFVAQKATHLLIRTTIQSFLLMTAGSLKEALKSGLNLLGLLVSSIMERIPFTQADASILPLGLSHPNFPLLVDRIWKEEHDLLTCIKHFSVYAQRWNTESFRAIGKRKRRLLNRIRGIQIKLEDPVCASSDFLSDLDVSLKEELEEVYFQEELLWIQKSSSDWLCLGDRNTHYYRLKATIRRKKNCIKQLKIQDGVWLLDETSLADHAEQFFKDLYSLEDPTFFPLSIQGRFPRLTDA
ncbi:hypothetical protein K1719_006724 [Acacia pycnantha]|nr:hypothetical protein K1719_006724 [Acacia pycnantha]